MKSKGNFVNGMWKQGTGNAFSSFSPNDDSVIWQGNSSSQKDVSDCVILAKEAEQNWQKKTVDERISYIKEFTEIVKSNKQKLAETISIEIGKPLWEALTEVNSVVGKLDLTVNAYKNRCSDITKEMSNGGISRTQL